MAIYHFHASLISRRDGRSSTAAAAYRAGERVVDGRTGEVHDFSRKRGVLHTQIVMPHGSKWAPSREELWSAVENKNKRQDAQVAREFIVALPAELSLDMQRELAFEFAFYLATAFQIAVDFAIHEPGKGGDDRNTHCHFLTSTNVVVGDGFGNKQRQLDLIAHNQNKQIRGEPNAIDGLREDWQNLCNSVLQHAGVDARIDRRSLVEQGIERSPQIHLGPTATAIERAGRGRSRRGQKADAEAKAFAAACEREDAAIASELAEMEQYLVWLEAVKEDADYHLKYGHISEAEYNELTNKGLPEKWQSEPAQKAPEPATKPPAPAPSEPYHGPSGPG